MTIMEDASGPELVRRDYTGVLRESCWLLVQSASEAEKAMSRDAGTDDTRPALDRSIVKMVLACNRAERLILPQAGAMEYFGLPRSVTAGQFDPDPTIRIQDPNREAWDFRPWLSEKLTKLRVHLNCLIETLEVQNGADFADEGDPMVGPATSPPAGESLAVTMHERGMYELRAARTYAQEVLSAIHDMGLTVVDWHLTR